MRTTLEWLGRAAVCGFAAGLVVRVLMFLWRKWLHIDVTQKEGGYLTAGVVGLLVGFRLIDNAVLAVRVGGVVVLAYFLIKWGNRVLFKS